MKAKEWWLAVCFGLAIIGFLGMLFVLVPWRPAGELNVEIWLPAGYGQMSEESQAKLVKRWTDNEKRIEVSSEIFKATKFRTAYVFGDRGTTAVYMTYLGEVEGAPIFYYNQTVPSTGQRFNYLVQEFLIQKSGVMIVRLTPDWILGIFLSIAQSLMAAIFLPWLLYQLGIWVIDLLGRKLAPAQLDK